MRTLSKRLKAEKRRRKLAEAWLEHYRKENVNAVKKKATSDANLNVSRNHVKNLQLQINEAVNTIYALCAICGDEFRLPADALKHTKPYVTQYDPIKDEWIFQKHISE